MKTKKPQSPKYSPLGNLPSDQHETERSSAIFDLIQMILVSRSTGSKIMLTFATAQLLFLTRLSWIVYQWHLQHIYQNVKRASLPQYLLHTVPGLFILPFIIGFMIWPTFLVIGLASVRKFQDLNTIAPHLALIRQAQLKTFTGITDYFLHRQIDAMDESIGNRLPEDIKWLIKKRLNRDHEIYKQRLTTSLRWQSRIRHQFEPRWTRVMRLWTLYTGINESYGIPTYLPIGFGDVWLCVFSRDGFLVCMGCLLRFHLIVWVLQSTINY